MRANRGSESRFLHFKDADSYLAYAKLYNKGGILSAMQGHVAKLAKDIALVEEMGPNPNAQFQFVHDMATRREGKGKDRIGRGLGYFISTRDMWNVLTGVTGSAVNPRLAEVAQGARNVEVFSKLGSAFLTSVTDIPTYFVTAGFNRLGFGKPLENMLRAFGKADTEFANRAGLIQEGMISDMNRWAEGNIGKGWTGKLANATMKLSLLEAWTDSLRRGYAMTKMGAMGKLTRGDWAALHESDRAHFDRAGVTETDFKVWQLAQPEDWRGSQMLTLDSLYRISDADLKAAGLSKMDHHRATSRLLGMLADESEMASLNQDLETRAFTTGGGEKGTLGGEFRRSFMLFKGFPLAMISRHWGRMADMWANGDKASSIGYGAAMITSLTVFGAMALQLKNIVNGKDPQDMEDPKFWAAAWAQGGGRGVFGDLLYTGLGGDSKGGQPNWTNVLGPVFGSMGDLANLTVGNIGQAMDDKDTHFGAEAVRFVKQHLPFVNLWYAKAAIDHAVLQDVQEYLSPGYLDRMRERAQKDFNQDFWWQPGEGMPGRAPDLGAAMGR
jgi:hypothetical protein